MAASVLSFLFVIVTVLRGVAACPSRCLCFRTTVRCMFLQLEHIPRVPSDATILDLRFNKIKSIPRGSFRNLARLNTLLLNNNEIEVLQDGAFEGLTDLRYLYLYKNKIRKMQRKVFKDLPKLEQLFLHSNNIQRLPRGIFSFSKHLRRLRLDSNSLVCDCEMVWLAEMLKKKHGHTQAAATCQYPENLQGRSLMSISMDDFHCRRPHFTMEPRDVDVTFGNTAYFTCRAEGNPEPEITWLHNENNIDLENGRYSVLDDGTLMIQSTQDADKGVYECVARNVAGEVKTNKVELRYFGEPVMPKFMETPNDVIATLGETIQLQCQATGNPRPDISWMKNEAPLASNSRYNLLPDGSLAITNLQVQDEGIYSCSAANSILTISSKARVTVQVPPTFRLSPEDVSARPGEAVSFTCAADGHPSPIISWLKDAHPLPNNGRYEIVSGGQTLRIQNTDSRDLGVYLCKAENAAGHTIARARLSIAANVAPSFPEQRSVIAASKGSAITMECSAEGQPEPRYRWTREGTPIRSEDRHLVDGNRLIIRNVQIHDAGRYECTAINEAGRSQQTLLLQVEGARHMRFRDEDLRNTPLIRQQEAAVIQNAVQQARNNVNTAINTTVAQLFDRNRRHSVQELLAIFRYPNPEALELARAEEIFVQTMEIIHRHVEEGHQYNLTGHGTSYRDLVSPAHLALIANMSGCHQQTRNPDCSNTCFHRQYRTADGSCNNFQHPKWGTSNMAFRRLVAPIYENGLNTPVGWNRAKLYRGYHLPSPRLVSSLMMSTDHVTTDKDHTHMLMQWGQFFDHDMDLTPQSVSFARFSDGRRCNETCDNSHPCFPIPVPNSDPRIQSHACLGFARSSATCNTGTTSLFFNTVAPREQINALTAFIDASNVYGSTQREAEDLRDLSSNRGLLRVGPLTLRGKRLLPFDDNSLHPTDCQIETSKRHVPCFKAGDHRANEQLALTAMHTLWMREHNRIATILLQLNPHWDGNKIYQETRKIVGAVMQHITYEQWMPKILGPKGMAMLGAYQGYDPTVDPTITNEFATAAMRFGHSLVQPVMFRLNETFQPTKEGNLPLHRAFFSPYRLMEEGGIDPLLRGMFGMAAKKRMPGEMLNAELTEKLFELANTVGQDLASLNIQRGRDHGLPFYTSFRKYCNLTVPGSFDDMQDFIQHRSTREKLQALYGHPDTIDLFVGGMSETPLEKAKFGPTFMCIMVDQFKRLRDGDRFWYENTGVFSAEQLQEVKKSSLARVICDNSDSIDKIQTDVFLREEVTGGYKACDDIPQLDLRMWTDCCEDCRRHGRSRSFRRHFRGRRSVEYSYPENRPQSDQPFVDQDDFNSAMNVTVTEGVSRTEQATCKLHHCEMMENRIEALESVMEQMSKELKQMQTKLHHLQKQVKRKNGKSCVHNGKRRKHNSTWVMDECTDCSCKRGQVECVKTSCPRTECQEPQIIPGECCPVC